MTEDKNKKTYQTKSFPDDEWPDSKNRMRYTRLEIRRHRKEALRQSKEAKNPARFLFWGLMLILWAVLIFLVGQKVLAVENIWKAFIIGLGAIFLVQFLFNVFMPAYRSYAMGRLIPGIILIFIGLGLLLGFSTWWPLALVIAGVAVIFISWFLQKEIEKRRITLENLHESEIKYRYIIDNANSVIMEMDAGGKIIFVNKYALNFFGFRENELLGQAVIGTIIAATPTALDDQQKMFESILINKNNSAFYLHNEKENLLKNGEKVWMVWTYKPIFDEQNNLKEILCTGIDRTQQKQAEDLAALQVKEQTAAEERTRLARDLHDAVSQTLFSASLIAEVLPKVWDRNKEEGLKKLEEVRQLTRGALAEMRTLLFELRPASLADAELNDLLRQLAESISGRARLPVKLEVEGKCEIPTDVKIALYRIAQEALNNIIKHSGADRAMITLHCQPDSVRLNIIDNGKGFDLSQVSHGSFGLGNMNDRAGKIGATFRINSKINEGTEITVTWQVKAGEVLNGTIKSN